MSYLEKKKIGKDAYYYLAKNIRTDGKFKKFRAYLGKGKLSKSELEKLKTKHSKTLEKRIENHLKSHDPLLRLLSKKQIEDLEILKKNYKKKYAKLPEEIKKKHYEDFLIRFTYNTNAIEGSTVTLGETKLILLDKISPPNRTLKEIKETENHKKAFDFVLNYKGDITENFILKIHKILTDGILNEIYSGKIRSVQVIITGVNMLPPRPENVETELKKLLKWYNKNKKKYHPVVLTSYFHAKFEEVHPFIDFNGRTGRLLLNFILMKSRYPVIDIKYKNRLEYYNSLQAAQKNNLKPFVSLVTKYINEELNRI